MLGEQNAWVVSLAQAIKMRCTMSELGYRPMNPGITCYETSRLFLQVCQGSSPSVPLLRHFTHRDGVRLILVIDGSTIPPSQTVLKHTTASCGTPTASMSVTVRCLDGRILLDRHSLEAGALVADIQVAVQQALKKGYGFHCRLVSGGVELRSDLSAVDSGLVDGAEVVALTEEVPLQCAMVELLDKLINDSPHLATSRVLVVMTKCESDEVLEGTRLEAVQQLFAPMAAKVQGLRCTGLAMSSDAAELDDALAWLCSG